MGNQMGDDDLFVGLCDDLKNIIDTHSPDAVALNEVLANHTTPARLEGVLKALGYKHVVFVRSGSWGEDYDIGNLIASKKPLRRLEPIILGAHLTEDDGLDYSQQDKAAVAEIKINTDVTVLIISAHLMRLRTNELLEHMRHQKKVSNYLKQLDDEVPFVLCGDFNEPNLFPLSFTLMNFLKYGHKSGGVLRPSWQPGGNADSVFRANPDKVVWNKQLLHLQSFQIVESSTSDHRPLIATFGIEA